MSCCDGKNSHVVLGHQSPDDVHLFPGVDATPIGRKHQLQDLQFSFPPHDGNQLEYGRPTVLDNGDIEFRGGLQDPPELNGYYRDPQSPRLFHQLWGECAMRLSGSHTQPETGALTIKMICNHPEAEHFQRQITAKNCAGCPLRVDPANKKPAAGPNRTTAGLVEVRYVV